MPGVDAPVRTNPGMWLSRSGVACEDIAEKQNDSLGRRPKSWAEAQGDRGPSINKNENGGHETAADKLRSGFPAASVALSGNLLACHSLLVAFCFKGGDALEIL